MTIEWSDDGVGGRTFEVRLHPQLRIVGGWLPSAPRLARYWSDIVVSDLAGEDDLGDMCLFSGQCARDEVETKVATALAGQLTTLGAGITAVVAPPAEGTLAKALVDARVSIEAARALLGEDCVGAELDGDLYFAVRAIDRLGAALRLRALVEREGNHAS